MKKKIYGRKLLRDDWGKEYFVDNELIGEEEAYEFKIYFLKQIKAGFLESALRNSPPSALMSHLTRLGVHKRIGSTETDRALLLHDYAEALKNFPEFIVFLACRSIWEGDESPWYPKIPQLVRFCVELKNAFEFALTQNKNENKMLESYKAPSKGIAVRPEETSEGRDKRRVLCDFIVSKGGDDLFGNRSYSNYQIERMAKAKYGWVDPEAESEDRRSA